MYFIDGACPPVAKIFIVRRKTFEGLLIGGLHRKAMWLTLNQTYPTLNSMKEKKPNLLKMSARHLLYGLAILLMSFSAVSAQEVRGKITDENEGPLPGVSVVEKGTTNGTVTDSEGAF